MDISDFHINFKKKFSEHYISDILDIPITILKIKGSKSRFLDKENKPKTYLTISYKIKDSTDDLIRQVGTNSIFISDQIKEIYKQVNNIEPPQEFVFDQPFDCMVKRGGKIMKFYYLETAKVSENDSKIN